MHRDTSPASNTLLCVLSLSAVIFSNYCSYVRRDKGCKTMFQCVFVVAMFATNFFVHYLKNIRLSKYRVEQLTKGAH